MEFCDKKESSIGRVWQHSTEYDFALISAFKSGLSITKNKQRNEVLEEDIRSYELWFSKHKGVYTYDDGIKEEEDSYLIVNKEVDGIILDFEDFKEIVLDLVIKHEQESALIHELGVGYYLLHSDGVYKKKGTKMSIGDIEDFKNNEALTRIGSNKTKAFIFEGVYRPPHNTYGVMFADNIKWIY